ncbi:hypothetical protein MOQ_005017, partial [Trypanosoma cruzi marinkellei]
HPAMRVTHHKNNNWVGAVQQQSKQNRKEERSSPLHRSSHSHSHCYCYSLSSGPHRHATLTSTHAPPSTGLGIVMRSRCAATSCRFSSPIMSATPNAYRRTCSMRCNHTRIRLAVMHCILLLSSFCLEQTLPHPINPRPRNLREAAKRCRLCERRKCAETTATLAPSHVSAPPTLPHTRAVSWGKEARRTAHARGHTQQQHHPRRTATYSHAHNTHTRPHGKRNGAHPSTHRCLLLLSHLRRIGVPHSQVRHGAHHPL